MSAQLRRIGKSLIQYFKPIRMTLPHNEPRIPADPTIGDIPALNLIKLDERRSPEQGQLRQDGQSPQERLADELPPPLEPARAAPVQMTRGGRGKLVTPKEEHEPTPLPPGKSQWLELVVYMLEACRRASFKTTRKVGLDTYRKSIQDRGKHKMNSVIGSIVDTSPGEDQDQSPDKKTEAA